MKKLLSLVLIVGFVVVDFLFFHDILKPGEITTVPQYLTGLLSIPVMIASALTWFDDSAIWKLKRPKVSRP